MHGWSEQYVSAGKQFPDNLAGKIDLDHVYTAL